MGYVSPKSRTQRIEVVQIDDITKENVVRVIDAGVIGATGPTGVGLPAGGAAGTVLTKNSNTDFDSSFTAIPTLTGITNEQLAVMPANTIKGPISGSKRPDDLTVAQAISNLSIAPVWNQITSIFVNGWIDYASPFGPPRLRLVGLEKVELRGLISGGTAIPSIIGTIFAGYRPAYEVIVSTACAGGTCEIRVSTAGTITVQQVTTAGANPNSWLSLSGITYSILA